ncbi:MAG TPA: hypothetical protein VKB35_05890 [Ktedonobacteraceae bacterium]|nr:hypothetical protein [Ktedonobacteraceae bacterium]
MLRDVLRETWPYQNIPQEGHEEELPQQFQQAFLQGLHQAHKEILQELRLTLLKIVRVRFPNVVRLAKKQTVGIEDVAILRDLIVKMSITQSAEEAVMYLLEVDEDEDEED